MTTLIYAYTKNNEAYIGKTKNPSKRKLAHKKLYNNWDYKVLDEIPSVKKEDWKPYETAWIQIYNEWGYEMLNKNKGGGGPDGWRTELDNTEYQKQWRLKNPNYDQQYNQNNKSQISAYCKQRYKANRERLLEEARQYRLKNKNV